MPDFKNNLTRGMDRLKGRLRTKPIPNEPAPPPASPPDGEARERLRKQNQRLERLRREAAREEEALAKLRAKLAETRKEALSSGLFGDGAPVFFLVGRAKSGTSWLMRILDSHPEVLCRGEGVFFGRDYRREKSDGERAKPQSGSLQGAIAGSEPLRGWLQRSVWTREEDVEEHLDNITGLATDYFLKAALSETGKKIVGDKTPFTGTEMVAEIARIRPGSRLIHIIRDGRDVAVSAMHHVWNHAKHEGGIHPLTPGEIETRDAYRADPQAFLESGRSIFGERQLAGTAKNWAEMVTRTMEDGPKLLGENYVEVRYEDLLERPEGEARRIFGFLGADTDEVTVRSCVESASFEKRARGRERGQEDSTAFMRKGVAGDWKNVFTEEDRRAFKEAAGDTLVKLGYEQDCDW